jgi:hypothetical protein
MWSKLRARVEHKDFHVCARNVQFIEKMVK